MVSDYIHNKSSSFIRALIKERAEKIREMIRDFGLNKDDIRYDKIGQISFRLDFDDDGNVTDHFRIVGEVQSIAITHDAVQKIAALGYEFDKNISRLGTHPEVSYDPKDEDLRELIHTWHEGMDCTPIGYEEKMIRVPIYPDECNDK